MVHTVVQEPPKELSQVESRCRNGKEAFWRGQGQQGYRAVKRQAELGFCLRNVHQGTQGHLVEAPWVVIVALKATFEHEKRERANNSDQEGTRTPKAPVI